MRVALLEVVAMQGGHEIEFDRLIVQSLRENHHTPIFLVPENSSFKINYGTEVFFLKGGSVIAHSGTSPIKRIVLSVLRAVRRILWFSDAVRVIKKTQCDAVIIPSATPRFIQSILHSQLKFSPVPVHVLVHGLDPKDVRQLVHLAKECLPFPNILISLLTLSPLEELKPLKNVQQIPPQTFTPTQPKDSFALEKHSPCLRFGFFGWYRTEKKLDVLLDAFCKAHFSRNVKFVVQAIAQGKTDNTALQRLIKQYESNPAVEFLQKQLISEEWEKALAGVDVVVLPYAAKWHRYKWSAMLFNALGFHKPVLLSEDINPELLRRYRFGETVSLNNPSLLCKELETFVDQFAEKASLYEQALIELNKDFSPKRFIQRVLENPPPS